MPTLETRAEVGLVRPASRPRFPGPAKGVATHYNGPAMGMAGKPHEECQARWRGIQRFHMGRNHPNPQPNGRHWQDGAYTAAVCHHGIVMEGRGKDVRTAANGTNQANNTYYAVFFMVGGDEEPSPEMLRAAEWYASEHLSLSTWANHGDFRPTSCAGRVADHIDSNGRLTVPTGTATAPESEPEPSRESTWTEALVKNLPTRRRRTNLSIASNWDRRVQGLLVANGHAPDNTIDSRGRVDGKFGPGTDAAVRAFQRGASIGVDGIVGPVTWTKLLGR